MIVGGESGPGRGRCRPNGSRRIRDQCQRAGVPFFFKQWGGVRKAQNGRKLHGRTYDEFPPIVRETRPPDARSLAIPLALVAQCG